MTQVTAPGLALLHSCMGGNVRGPAPGSRESALLQPEKPVAHVNALMLAGGSAFGLAAADGAMRYLAEHGIGHPTPIRPIPIVPAAIVYDQHQHAGLDSAGGKWSHRGVSGARLCRRSSTTSFIDDTYCVACDCHATASTVRENT